MHPKGYQKEDIEKSENISNRYKTLFQRELSYPEVSIPIYQAAQSTSMNYQGKPNNFTSNWSQI
jgi:hypothetical protein